MKVRVFGWLILLTGVLVVAGCPYGQSTAAEIGQQPPKAIQVSPPPQPFIFYDETGDPSGETMPLSETELRESIDWVAAQTPDRIWLIRVRPSPEKGIRNDMVAYLVPDETTTRVRVGRAYDIPASKTQTGIPSAWRYTQISLRDHGFGAQLTKPSFREMPFEYPVVPDSSPNDGSSMTNEEVTAIVDFVRQPSSYEGRGVRAGVPKDMAIRRILASPILKIERSSNHVYVTFGYMHGALWGHGLTVTLKRVLGGYRTIAWSMWIS